MRVWLRISGRDLRTLVEETAGSTECDLTKSHENTNSEEIIQIALDDIPGIQKWRQ